MRFRVRILLLLAGLVAAALGVMLLVVNRSAEREAVADIRGRFDRAAGVFQKLVVRQNDQAAALASLLAADYAFKLAFADDDKLTVESSLSNLLDRAGTAAHAIAIVRADGDTQAAFNRDGPIDAPRLFGPLIKRAEDADIDRTQGYVWLEGRLHEFVFVPMFAPGLVAWVGLGIRIDDALASDLGQRANLDVLFLRDGTQVVATTLRPEAVGAFVRTFSGTETLLTLAGERHLVVPVSLPDLAEAGASAFVLASLDASLAPTRRLQSRLLLAGAGLLAVALLAAILFARSLSRPVQQLAAHTRLIASGDYKCRLYLHRRDELGELADSFNAMSLGLAERDQARDLLDKNVSPEVAARMMRDGTGLGGEEREVTVLFCDLRGFTPLSEGLAPPELVTLLNRYLDRMSAAIEQAGGIVDKYIGDEIMALFGAPESTPDAADRAVRAALAMRAALVGLNRELAAEGRPPLAFGVGINTARVVAGNIGSHRRHNYSVIGDGVNLAARLQTLTRRPEFATDIIISDFTRAALISPVPLRDLGEVTVKGKTVAVRIHTIA